MLPPAWQAYAKQVANPAVPAAKIPPLNPDYILVKKAERKLYIMQKGKAVAQFTIRLGGNPLGHKQQEGDQKTPEGIYWLDSKNPKSSYYRSMHISYPNRQDKASAKKRGVSAGGDIMLHGQMPANATGKNPPYDWTLGCIAVDNAVMDALWHIKLPMKIEIQP